MKKFLTLFKIEGKLTLRSIDAIFFGVCMPIGIMLLIGLISGNNPATDGAGYTLVESSFAALIAVGICATAFMGIPLTIADYRDKKNSQAFFCNTGQPNDVIMDTCSDQHVAFNHFCPADLQCCPVLLRVPTDRFTTFLCGILFSGDGFDVQFGSADCQSMPDC